MRVRGLPHGHPRRARRDPRPRQPRGPGRVRARVATSGRSRRRTRGRFAAELAPVTVRDAKGRETVVDADEGPRRDSTLEALARLKPVFDLPTGEDRGDATVGTVTAGNAPGITDGAAATVVASERAVERLRAAAARPDRRLRPGRGRPEVAVPRPGHGVRRLLDRIELPIEAFDLIEINEAFAAQTLADGRELGFDWDKVNVNGGAIALGHPIGASGARIVATLLHELRPARGPLRARDAVPRRRRLRRDGRRAGRRLRGRCWRRRPARDHDVTLIDSRAPPLADTPLGRTIATTATDIWNDSCAVDELEYAISFGAVGATANPTIVTDVWKADPARWRDARRATSRPSDPTCDRGRAGLGDRRRDVARAAPLLLPAFEAQRRPPGPAVDADRPDPLSVAPSGCSPRASTSTGSPRTSS